MRPPRYDVLGTWVDAVDPEAALAAIRAWIAAGDRRYVCAVNVHGVMEAGRDAAVAAAYAGAGLVVPDGMPIVWAGHLAGHPRVRRVYGPDLTLLVCAAAAREGWSCYFYGGGTGVAQAMAQEMSRRFPGLRVAGAHSPPFRPLSAAADTEDLEETSGIDASRAQVVFVGLGCPKQELWMAAHQGRLPAVLLGVGAAFDLLTGGVPQAPRWMMSLGLEWLFRLLQEPRRLWYRYLVYNPLFVARFAWQVLTRGRRPQP